MVDMDTRLLRTPDDIVWSPYYGPMTAIERCRFVMWRLGMGMGREVLECNYSTVQNWGESNTTTAHCLTHRLSPTCLQNPRAPPPLYRTSVDRHNSRRR